MSMLTVLLIDIVIVNVHELSCLRGSVGYGLDDVVRVD